MSTPATDPTQTLLEKLRAFAVELDDDERVLFAVLVGPGVAALMSGNAEVEGFEQPAWTPGSLRERLADAVIESEWQIVEPR